MLTHATAAVAPVAAKPNIVLIIHDLRPPEAERGRVLSERVLNSDLASTMIDLAGLPVPEGFTGRSMSPLLRSDKGTDWRKDFLCEFLVVPRINPRWEGVRGSRATDARYFVGGPEKPPYEFLFDFEKDLEQLINLALSEVSHPFLKGMRRRGDQLVASAGPPMTEIGENQESSRKGSPRKK